MIPEIIEAVQGVLKKQLLLNTSKERFLLLICNILLPLRTSPFTPNKYQVDAGFPAGPGRRPT